jgi:hypothetical protein
MTTFLLSSHLLASFANDDEDYYEGLHDPSSNSSSSLRGVHFRHVFAHDRSNLDAIAALTSNMPEILLHLDICSLVIKRLYEFLFDVLVYTGSKTGQAILHFDNYLFSAETAWKILDVYIAIVGKVVLDSQVQISDIAIEY